MVSSFYQNETKERFAIDHYVFHSFRFGICWICSPNFRGERMKEQLHLKNHLKEVRTAANLFQEIPLVLLKLDSSTQQQSWH